MLRLATHAALQVRASRVDDRHAYLFFVDADDGVHALALRQRDLDGVRRLDIHEVKQR